MAGKVAVRRMRGPKKLKSLPYRDEAVNTELAISGGHVKVINGHSESYPRFRGVIHTFMLRQLHNVL